MSNAKYSTLVNKINAAANKLEAAQNGKGRRKNAGQGRSKRQARQLLAPGSSVLENHWRMLHDPCYATLAESAYRGRAGIVSRFTGVNTYTAGAFTAAAFVFNPAATAGTQFAVAASNTPATPVYDQVMPGQAYLFTTAETWRVIGMCVDIDYVGTELNRSGMIYGGIVPANQVAAGVATTVDQIKVLLSNTTRTPDREIAQMWFPGVGNENYIGESTGVSFQDANNSLVLCFENMPTGLQVRLRVTTIYEWLPRVNTGIIMPSPVTGNNPPAAYEKLFEKARATPGFIDSFRQGASDTMNRAAYYAGSAGVNAAANYMLRRGNRRGGPRSITFQ